MGDTKTLDYLIEREKARRIVNLAEGRRNSVANNDMLIDYYQRQKNKELYGIEHPQIDPEKVREFLEDCEHERFMEACADGKLSEYYAEKRKKEQKLERLKKLINDGGLYTML